jgi:hypothetical protein
MTVFRAHVSEIEPVPLDPDDELGWKPVRARLGIAAFGVNVWTAERAGAQVIGPHVETDEQAGGHEELYFVLSGRATFRVDGETIDAPVGTFVSILDPAAKRMAVAEEDDTAVLAIGGRVGAPFEVAAWESIVGAAAHARASNLDAAIDEIEHGLASNPRSSTLLYHAACYESRAGRSEAALGHLARSLLEDPGLRRLAAREPDFESIRRLPGFEQLVGS